MPTKNRKLQNARRRQPAAAKISFAGGRPETLAAIDIGTTSVRMGIAELHPDGKLNMVDELVHPVAIGTDTFRVGYLKPNTARALSQVLINFMQVMEEYGVKEYRAVATSGIREASNQEVVLDRLQHDCGIEIAVLDPVEESRLTYQNLLPFLKNNIAPAKDEYTMLFDLGGGSTEVMVLQGENLVFAGSRRLGTSRLFHRISCAECGDSQVLLESVVRNVINSTLDLYRSYPIKHCLIVNKLLQKVFAGVKQAKPVPGGIAVPARTTLRIAGKSADSSGPDLVEEFSLAQTDSELVVSALMVLERFLENIKVRHVNFAEVDLLSGILNDMAIEIRGGDPFALFSQQIVSSAKGIGSRYLFDKKHSQKVTDLAEQLFGSVADYFDLTQRDGLYLKVAALLHDIGMFISERAHHKHSAYLIKWAEIVGLSEREQNFVALLARYHRKAMPAAQHEEFISLSRHDRLRVSKLSAILRIADALDRGHEQAVRSARIEIKDEDAVIIADSSRDLAVEAAALRDKADLFEHITGLKVHLRRQLS